MKILHFADIHLDRSFPGIPRDLARARRAGLRLAFQRCLAIAREREADLITIGGDLWEDEHVTDDTRRFVAHELGRAGSQVVLICGNHDPWLSGGHYARVSWPDNVRVCPPGELTEIPVGPVSIWGMSWGGGPLDLGFLNTFRVPDTGRIHLLLLHGTARPPGMAALERASDEYGPFDPAQIHRCGFALCLAGHIHRARHDGAVVYPGSPEPLGWGEPGRHCVAMAETGGGPPRVELIDVNRRRYVHRDVDCSGASSSAAVAEALALALADHAIEVSDASRLCLRLDLVGQIPPECEIDLESLAGRHRARYAELVIHDRTLPEYDLETLAREQTARGWFVKSLRGRIAAAASDRDRERLELALILGLHGLGGRRELIRVD